MDGTEKAVLIMVCKCVAVSSGYTVYWFWCTVNLLLLLEILAAYALNKDKCDEYYSFYHPGYLNCMETLTWD